MEKEITVDGLKTRYLEDGTGPVLLLLHGASIGSSAVVYEKNIPFLAKVGMRVFAYDAPGYGLTDNPEDYSDAYRGSFIVKFMDALGIPRASLVAHSAPGRVAARIALSHPDRVEKLVLLGCTPLLPPLPDQRERAEADPAPPTLASARKQLENDLFNKSLITDEMVEKRLNMSTGKNFDAAVERAKAAKVGGGSKEEVPLWKQLAKSSLPKLYLFGREDRGGTAAKRCALLADLDPKLNVQLIDRCSHLVMIDAEEEFNRRVAAFVKE